MVKRRKTKTWFSAALLTAILLSVSNITAQAKIQQGWSVSWSILTTNEADNTYTGGQIWRGDGAEYEYQVTGASGNARFKWFVSPSDGVFHVYNPNAQPPQWQSYTLGAETEFSRFKWQSSLTNDEYNVRVRAWTVGGEGEGGDTLKAKWLGTLKKSFVDIYFEDAGVESDEDVYLVATPEGEDADTIGVTALVTKLEVTSAHTGSSHDHGPFNPLEDMLLQWEELNKSGTPGALNSLTSERTNPAGEVLKTFTADANGGTGSVNYKAKLEVKTGGEVDSETSEKIYVLEVELYKDSGYTEELTDWPESGDQDRSPKCILGEDDPIYVQVKNLGTDPNTAETINNAVKVTSESDSSGIYLTLKETGADTQIFRNSEAAGELLYLSTSSSEGDGDKIEVVDEEILTFGVKTNGSYSDCIDVMVDRGEFASATGEDTNPIQQAWLNNSRSEFEEHIDKDEAGRIEELEWWENGEQLGDDCTKAFVQAAGDTPNDFFYMASHGYNGVQIDQNDNIWFFSNEADNWTDELEWIIFWACEVLGEDGDADAFIEDWDDHLLDRQIHGILSLCNTGTTDGSDEVDDFFKYACENSPQQTVREAWKSACLEGPDEEYAVLMHWDNRDDKLPNDISADTDDNGMGYWYYNNQSTGEYQASLYKRDRLRYLSASFCDFFLQSAYAKEVLELNDGKVTVVAEIPDKTPIMVPLVIEKENVNELRLDRTGFTSTTVSVEDGVRMSINEGDSIPSQLSEDRALAVAKEFIERKGGGFPTDALLDKKGMMQVIRYECGKLDETREEFTEGYVFKFGHAYNGYPIVGDVISVVIQADEVRRFVRCWSHPAGIQRDSEYEVILARQALDVAIQNARSVYMLPSTYQVKNIDLVYLGRQWQSGGLVLRPAWRILIRGNKPLYVDALNGTFIDHTKQFIEK